MGPPTPRNTPGKAFFLAFFRNGQQTLLEGDIGDGIDHIADRDPWSASPMEADQHRLGHLQRHEAQGSGKGHQTRSSRERNA